MSPRAHDDRVQWIDDPLELERVADVLGDAEVIGVDTEQDSYFAYATKVCVLQIGALGREWVVDTLAIRDFSCLDPVFRDDRVTKVFHAGENDVDLLRRQCGLEFFGLFDTMSAASILGYRKTGLAGLLEEHFGVVLEKKFQRSDWRKRPLSREQIEYAALDVRHLEDLMDKLEEELDEKGRLAEAASDFDRVARVVHEQRPFDADDYWRISGARDLDARGRAVLRAVYEVRESIARDEDRALFRVCGDHVLVEVARRKPRDVASLRRLRGFPERLGTRYGDDFVDAILAAVEGGGIPKPRPRASDGPNPMRLDPAQKSTYDRLRRWRKERAERRGVEPGRVIPNAMLLRVIHAAPADVPGLAEAGLEPWRIDEYGEDLLSVLGQAP